MKKQSDAPQSLSEAIEKLESVSGSTVQGFKNILEKDYAEIKKSLENLKPHLTSLQENLETEVIQKKQAAEMKVKENPWLTIGIVGFLAFILGLFCGSRKNKKD